MPRLIQKLFYYNSWTIAWRMIDEKTRESLPIAGNRISYKLFREKESCFYADPFIVEDGNEVFLFVESLNRWHGKGTISVSRLDDNGRFTFFREVLREPFHLSFPNVFRFGDTYYMIPETADSKQIRLYRAIIFPDMWELDTVLLDDGKRYVDSSLQIKDDVLILNCHLDYLDKNGNSADPPDGSSPLRRFRLDMEQRELREISKDGFYEDRPAGNCFTINNSVYRPTQNCTDTYGQGVFVYQINADSEQFCGEMKPENLILERFHHTLTGTHTLNRSEHFEVIDIKYNRFCFSKPWIRFARKFLPLKGE